MLRGGRGRAEGRGQPASGAGGSTPTIRDQPLIPPPPMPGGAPAPTQLSFKARAGRYRVRFVAMAPRTRPLSDPRNAVAELGVAVPEAGEARVRLELGGR